MIPPEYRHLPALAIRQPWASSIILGGKNIENRTRRSHYRGLVLIHASKGVADDEINAWCNHITYHKIEQTWGQAFPNYKDMPNAGIIGVAEIVDCVTAHSSPWFVGPYGYVIRNALPLEFTPCVGMLGFFKPKFAEAA